MRTGISDELIIGRPWQNTVLRARKGSVEVEANDCRLPQSRETAGIDGLNSFKR
jgi:hypothetical protein